jgi:hypothetical protein
MPRLDLLLVRLLRALRERRSGTRGARRRRMLSLPMIEARHRYLTAVLGERGDVPGWVLITAMTVALVMLLWGIASEALRDIVTRFLNEVRFD